VLDQVDLQIYDGHVTTIIGKSGTGKSVLLKHIIGLLAPTEGTVLFRGKAIRDMDRKEFDAFRRQFSYCFQNNALFDSLTVFGNIAMPLEQTTTMRKKEIEAKVVEKTQQLEIAEFLDKYPSELSGGMQKRVALARALVTDPKIVLFDEPTTGQDPIRKNAILSMIAQNQKRFGFTTIMISHEIPDVFFISNRILILYDGKIVFQGTYNELDGLNHPMVDEYIKSLQSFEDEFMGGDSENGGLDLFAPGVKGVEEKEVMTVAIFSIDDLDELFNRLEANRADEIIESLAEYVNRHFGEVGISYQLARNVFAAILNHTDMNAANALLDRFAIELREHGLGSAHATSGGVMDSEKCFGFTVRAGLVEGDPKEDIQVIADKAISKQKDIAHFFCS
jgi:phospholipid/cholesterol/gamma-HCH transport system ATP-binding protein